ncbi:MAG: glucose-6-phosphate 1-dehydrogenase, partial [Patescibacteria group bacterium]|nr:glucose-6-phosphate 1-dehydrogenase [Patescibacteria group bacterium]
MNTPPAQLIIFGITGDLARKKLLPALEHLAQNHLLPEPFEIVGVTRQQIQPADLIGPESALTPLLSVVTLDMTDPADYVRLKATLDA